MRSPVVFRWLNVLLLASVGLPTIAPALAVGATIQQQMWSSHVPPEDMVRIGDRVFLAGAGLGYVGPYSGGAQFVSTTDGAVVPGFPDVYAPAETQVKCVVPDGAGGWFIGGLFSRVGGQPRSNLAHVNADGSVSAWNPGANNFVNTLALDGGVLYVGGTFTQVGGQSRSRIAAINATTGAVTSWNPTANGLVNTIVVGASNVYAGGGFQFIGGQSRFYLAALSKTTGLATAFNPSPSNWVYELELDANKLYVGGAFTSFGSATRVRLAALDAGDGSVLPWDPGTVTGNITDFELDGGLLYVAGATSVNGQVRYQLAAVDTGTAALASFAPFLSMLTGVEAIAVEGGVVYAGGTFTQVGLSPGVRRLNAAAFDATTGALLDWNPMASTTVQSLWVSGSRVFVGGSMNGLNGVERTSLAALDAVTGKAAAFNPQFTSGVARVLETDGSRLFVGGQFNIGVSQPAPHALTSYDPVTLAWTGWSPNLNGEVTDMLADAGVLYVCGGFTQIDGQARVGIAAFDIATGTLLPWYPGACAGATHLAATATELIVGGAFGTLAGVARTRLGAIDRASGAVTAWNPGPNNTVNDVLVAGGRIYAGGDFTTVVGGARTRMAAWDAATGALSSWNASTNGSVRGLAYEGGRILAAGGFNLANNSSTRIGLAEFDATTGAVTTWNPGFDGNGRSVMVSGLWTYFVHEQGGFDGSGRAAFTPLIRPATADVDAERPSSATLQLASPRPNPLRGEGTLRLSVPAEAIVTVEVLDLAGRRVARPIAGARMAPGVHVIPIDVSGLAPGEYFARARAGTASATSKLVVSR